MKPNLHPGKLIALEGLDGSGQTSQAHLLVKWFSEKRGQPAYYTKEPSDGPVGVLLKLALTHRLVSSPNGRRQASLDEITMALCFAADRADHLNNEILPKLKEGIHVIADRYYLSSLAYQSVVAEYDWIKHLNKHCLRPDLTLFLDVPPAVCVKRMQMQRWHVELYEDPRVLEKVRQSYQRSVETQRLDGEEIEVLDGNQPVKDVHRTIVQRVKNLLVKSQQKLPADARQLQLLMETEPLSQDEIAGHQEG